MKRLKLEFGLDLLIRALTLLGMTAGGLGLLDTHPASRWLYDLGFQASLWVAPAERMADPRIVVVTLDESTLADSRVEQWIPGVLRRSEHARLLRELREGGARVAAFDIAFIGQSPDDAELFAELDRFPTSVLVAEARAAELGGGFELPEPALAAARSVRIASPVLKSYSNGQVRGVVSQQTAAGGATINALAYESWLAFTRRDDLTGSDDLLVRRPERLITIRWPGREGIGRALNTISYRDVVTGDWRRLNPRLFRNKLVLIGSTVRSGRADYTQTPVGLIPGVLAHACVLNAYLNDYWVSDPRRMQTWLLSAASVMIIALAGYLLRPLGTLLVLVATCLLTGALAVQGIVRGEWISFLHVWLAAVLSAIVGFGFRFAFAASALSRYAGADAARQLLLQRSIRARTQTATIFFADVRDYTQHSEQLSPVELMLLLNEHYTWMDHIIEKHRGRVDKHIGDAMMAVFEDVHRGKGHARRAIDAARELVASAGARQGRAAELGFGVGIHTGEVVTGELGTGSKVEYGSIGDAVNVAARLEQSTRLMEVVVLVSEDVAASAGEQVDLRPLGPISLKGKSEPVSVFTLP